MDGTYPGPLTRGFSRAWHGTVLVLVHLAPQVVAAPVINRGALLYSYSSTVLYSTQPPPPGLPHNLSL